MKLEALDHPKTLELCAQLGVELPTALGHLELLWAFTGKKAPQGNVGKWPDGAIARACYWMGDPKLFLQSLLQSGFIEASHEHRYVIHDWHEHAPRWVRAKLAKAKLGFVSSAVATIVVTAVGTSGSGEDDQGEDVETIEPTIVATTVAPSKGREEKGREEQEAALRACAAPTAPAGRQPTSEGEMAIALRDLGVVVRSIDPVLAAWLRDGYTTQQAVDAVGIARIRKPHPEPIAANYLDKILRQPIRPPPKAVDRVTWRPPPEEVN